MVSFDIFRIRSVTGANVCGFLLGAVVFANFFLLTLYVQQVLGYSALKTGLTFLATAGTAVATKATPATGCDNHAVFRLVEPDEWWSLPAGVFPLVGPKRDHRDCRDEAGDVRHAVRSRWPTRVCSNSP